MAGTRGGLGCGTRWDGVRARLGLGGLMGDLGIAWIGIAVEDCRQ